MRIKAYVAIHHLKALFKAYCRLAKNFNFIKGTVRNVHKTVQRKLCWDILLCFNHIAVGV